MALEKVRYLIDSSVAQTACGGRHRHTPFAIPTAPVQRHVEVLNEDRDKVAKVPVGTDTNGNAS
jgi:hypothetical protein